MSADGVTALATKPVDASLRGELDDLYARYASCLDDGPLEAWPGFFTEDCRYRLIPRENYAAGLPLATMALDGVGMLKDRIYAAVSTIFHAPYQQRHIIGPLLVTGEVDGAIELQANYLVIRTKRDGFSAVFNAGRYIDKVVSTPDGLRFAEKLCVFDSELIPNSIIYPI
jgi:salicylate 5-hydroxylase small subunit